MRTWKDTLKDGVLILLVLSSLLLSRQIWYPPHQHISPADTQASVQPSPVVASQLMPDVFRPEAILIRQQGNVIAPLHAGSVPYQEIWPPIREVITGLRASAGAYPVEEAAQRLQEGTWIQLRLPMTLTLSQWADLWPLTPAMPRNGSFPVDRVILYLGQPGAVYVTGPSGITMYLADIGEETRAQLLKRVSEIDATLFVEHRPLNLNGLAVRAAPDLLVAPVDSLPAARVRTAPADEYDEEARYFPDLSVVRQIDERGARSLTDGQRLLRITATGLLEYRTADPPQTGPVPELKRALALTQDWVGVRGGWPQEIVLRHYTQQSGKAKLEFTIQTGGPYPVESVESALRIDVTEQRIVYLTRYPAFVEMGFMTEQQPVITPEVAVQRAREREPSLGTQTIRAVYLTYLVAPDPTGAGGNWSMTPTWVIQTAEERIYIPAVRGHEEADPSIVR